ncbi:hypothetical protein ACFE04_009354 [Oxalis oulophora]
MAASHSIAVTNKPFFPFPNSPYLLYNKYSTSNSKPIFLLPPSIRFHGKVMCFTKDDEGKGSNHIIIASENVINNDIQIQTSTPSTRVVMRLAKKKSERLIYLVAAILSTVGITSMAALAVYYRISWQMEGGDVPLSEMFGIFALSIGAAIGMEFWAIWAHKALWHASLWHMHESHHKPREGPFELNDVFAIINAVPAIAFLAYGFFSDGLLPALSFGTGLGITLFGMAYMFVHDGLVHKRFPVGPIANVPYFRKVAAAHQLHHSEKFNGVPYGLFLGPKELKNRDNALHGLENRIAG